MTENSCCFLFRTSPDGPWPADRASHFRLSQHVASFLEIAAIACCIVSFGNLCSTFEAVGASEHACMKSEPIGSISVFQFLCRRKVRPEKSWCRHVCSLEYCVRSSSLQGVVLACREEFLGSTLLMHALACTKVYQGCFCCF